MEIIIVSIMFLAMFVSWIALPAQKAAHSATVAKTEAMPLNLAQQNG